MSTSLHRRCLAHLRDQSSAFQSTFRPGTTAVQTVRWARECHRRTSRRGTKRTTGAAVANISSYERSFAGVDRLQRLGLEDEPVGCSIEASNGQKLCDTSAAVDTCNVNDQMNGEGDRFADAPMR